jgi:hypothetical protein
MNSHFVIEIHLIFEFAVSFGPFGFCSIVFTKVYIFFFYIKLVGNFLYYSFFISGIDLFCVNLTFVYCVIKIVLWNRWLISVSLYGYNLISNIFGVVVVIRRLIGTLPDVQIGVIIRRFRLMFLFLIFARFLFTVRPIKSNTNHDNKECCDH